MIVYRYFRQRPLFSLYLLVTFVMLLIPGLAPGGVCMAMAVVTGARSNPATTGTPTGAIDASSRVIDMSDTIHLLDPNEAPLTAITMKLRKAHCINPKIEWLEDDYLPSTTTLSASLSASTVTAAVLHSATFVNVRKGDVLQNQTTGENMYVSSMSSASVTFTRQIGGVAAATATQATTDILLVIGNANEEGANSRIVKSTTKTNLSNFTQIFRWPFGLTGTLNQSETYGGSDLSYQTRKAGIEHRISMERSFMFGVKADDSAAGSGAAPIRFCDGVLARVTSNVSALGTATNAAMTTTTFETFLSTGMRYGPARKVLFASRQIMSEINAFATNRIVTVPTTTSFPLAITEYVSPHGKVYLVSHNLLVGAEGATKRYGGYALMLDMDSIFYRYLQGRDTTLKTNIQSNDADARQDEYLTEACPMVIQEKNHSVITSNVA